MSSSHSWPGYLPSGVPQILAVLPGPVLIVCLYSRWIPLSHLSVSSGRWNHRPPLPGSLLFIFLLKDLDVMCLMYLWASVGLCML